MQVDSVLWCLQKHMSYYALGLYGQDALASPVARLVGKHRTPPYMCAVPIGQDIRPGLVGQQTSSLAVPVAVDYLSELRVWRGQVYGSLPTSGHSGKYARIQLYGLSETGSTDHSVLVDYERLHVVHKDNHRTTVERQRVEPSTIFYPLLANCDWRGGSLREICHLGDARQRARVARDAGRVSHLLEKASWVYALAQYHWPGCSRFRKT